MSGQGTQIILYTHHGCADSRRVWEWLTARDVAFVERNVTGDLDAAKDLLEPGTFATPLLVVGDVRVLGYRPQKLGAALDRPLQPDGRPDQLRLVPRCAHRPARVEPRLELAYGYHARARAVFPCTCPDRGSLARVRRVPRRSSPSLWSLAASTAGRSASIPTTEVPHRIKPSGRFMPCYGERGDNVHGRT